MSLLEVGLKEGPSHGLNWIFGMLKDKIGQVADLASAQHGVRTFSPEDIKSTPGWNSSFRINPSASKGEEFDLAAELVGCYKRVPRQFMSESYVCRLDRLGRDLVQLCGEQIRLVTHLDDIEIMLFYLVNNKFTQFLQVAREVEQLSELVQQVLTRVKAQRALNRKADTVLVEQAKSLMRKTVRKERIKGLINKVGKMVLVSKLPPTLSALINSQNNERAIGLLKSYKQSLSELAGLRCFSNANRIIEVAQTQLRDGLALRVKRLVCQYILSELRYDKGGLGKGEALQSLNENSSFINDSLWNEDSKLCLTQSCRNPEKQVEVFERLLDLSYFSQEKVRLVDDLVARVDQFQRQFTADVGEAAFPSEQLLSEQSPEYDFSALSVQFHTRVVQIYSQLLRRTATRAVQLLDTVLVRIDQLSGKHLSQRPALLAMAAGLGESTCALVSRSKQSLLLLIGLKPINIDLDFDKFKLIAGSLGSWEGLGIKSALKDDLMKIAARVNFAPFKQARREIESNFVRLLTQYSMGTQLRESVEDEDWRPAEVGIEYMEVIGFILNGNGWLNSQDMAASTFGLSIEGSLSQLSRRTRRLAVGGDTDKSRPQRKFRILINTVVLEDKKYYLCKSALTLLQISDDFLNLKGLFPHFRQQLQEKLARLIRLFGEYSLQQVSSRQLSFSQLGLCLSTLQFIEDCLPNLLYQHNQVQVKSLKNYINELAEDIYKRMAQCLVNKIKELSNAVAASVTKMKAPTPSTVLLLQSLKEFVESIVRFSKTKRKEGFLSLLNTAVPDRLLSALRVASADEERTRAELRWLVEQLEQGELPPGLGAGIRRMYKVDI